MLNLDYYQDLGIFLNLIPITSAFWAAYALLINKERTFSQKYLALFFISLGIALLFNFWYDRYIGDEENKILRSINMALTIFCIILVLFYFMALMRPDKLTKCNIIKSLLAGLGYSLILLIPENIFGHTEDIAGWNEILGNITHPVILFRLAAVLCIVLFVIYLFVKILKMYKQHKKTIREQFSYDEDIDLRWIYKILLLFLFFAAIDLAWILNSSITIKIVFNIVGMILILRIFWLGFRQREVPITFEEEAPLLKEDKQEDDNYDTPYSLAYQVKMEQDLLDYFKKEKPFLNSGLALNDVAERLGTNRTYLSQLINRRFNVNFYAFVNKYRIEYALKLMKKDTVTSIEQIREQSGFKSKSVFHRQFREITGETPLKFRKKDTKKSG